MALSSGGVVHNTADGRTGTPFGIGGGIWLLACEEHGAGTWGVQFRSNADGADWAPVDGVSFMAAGVQELQGADFGQFRILGATGSSQSRFRVTATAAGMGGPYPV